MIGKNHRHAELISKLQQGPEEETIFRKYVKQIKKKEKIIERLATRRILSILCSDWLVDSQSANQNTLQSMYYQSLMIGVRLT